MVFMQDKMETFRKSKIENKKKKKKRKKDWKTPVNKNINKNTVKANPEWILLEKTRKINDVEWKYPLLTC